MDPSLIDQPVHSANPVLRFHSVTKTFSRKGRPDFTAVDHVSFDLMPGECLGIIGESGSGKSTIANIAVRLLNATEGQVFLDGEDITVVKGGDLRRIYRKIQMVFQMPTESFDPRRTLGDGIGESLRNMGMSRKEAEREVEGLLGLCHLEPEFAARYPHQVSGGQCQRAAIARALAVKPKVLICDEATSALDVTIQKEIMELLGELRRQRGEGLSILFISHDIALVQQFCSRILVMHKGRIVEEGDPGEIIRNPKDAYTRRLIDSIL
ncbi:MAG: ABC transporter ATP-binding protein [Lachnospiraceae bacterium]|nr:ABC transporter ATP-binding protein [Lachnospiraceae bacterium]